MGSPIHAQEEKIKINNLKTPIDQLKRGLEDAVLMALNECSEEPLSLSRQTRSNSLQVHLRIHIERRREVDMMGISYYPGSEFWWLSSDDLPLHVALGRKDGREFRLQSGKGNRFPHVCLTPSMFGDQNIEAPFLILVVDRSGHPRSPRAWLVLSGGISAEDGQTLMVLDSIELFDDAAQDRVVIDL